MLVLISVGYLHWQLFYVFYSTAVINVKYRVNFQLFVNLFDAVAWKFWWQEGQSACKMSELLFQNFQDKSGKKTCSFVWPSALCFMLIHLSVRLCVCVFLHFLISLLSTSGCFVFVAHYSAFSALTLSVGRQEGYLACKNWVLGCWHGYLSGARCRLFAYGPADATALPKPHQPQIYLSLIKWCDIAWNRVGTIIGRCWVQSLKL